MCNHHVKGLGSCSGISLGIKCSHQSQPESINGWITMGADHVQHHLSCFILDLFQIQISLASNGYQAPNKLVLFLKPRIFKLEEALFAWDWDIASPNLSVKLTQTPFLHSHLSFPIFLLKNKHSPEILWNFEYK